jgi:hypothetical protein
MVDSYNTVGTNLGGEMARDWYSTTAIPRKYCTGQEYWHISRSSDKIQEIFDNSGT